MKFIHVCPDHDFQTVSENDLDFVYCWCEFKGLEKEVLDVKKKLFLQNGVWRPKNSRRGSKDDYEPRFNEENWLTG